LIYAGNDFLGFLPLGAPGGLFPDRLPQFATAFRAGFTVRVAFATSRFPPRQPEAPKLDALILEVHDAGLLLVELESSSLQPAFEPMMHLFALPFTAEDNEVVGVSHHHRLHLASPVDRFIQAVEVQVSQQRRDDVALWCSAPILPHVFHPRFGVFFHRRNTTLLTFSISL